MGSGLPPAIDPPPPPQDDPPVRGSKLVCEFCGCALAPSGDVLKVSARAREIREQDETIRDLKADLAAAETAADTYRSALERAERERDAALSAAQPKGFWRQPVGRKHG